MPVTRPGLRRSRRGESTQVEEGVQEVPDLKRRRASSKHVEVSDSDSSDRQEELPMCKFYFF